MSHKYIIMNILTLNKPSLKRGDDPRRNLFKSISQILDISLYEILHKLIGLSCLIVFGLAVLGTSVIHVLFNSFQHVTRFEEGSYHTPNRLTTIPQFLRQQIACIPSRPGAFKGLICFSLDNFLIYDFLCQELIVNIINILGQRNCQHKIYLYVFFESLLKLFRDQP